MDNLEQLSAMLTPLLSDPETMSSLRAAAEQMGLGGLLPEDTAASADDEKTPREPTPSERPSPQPADGMNTDILSAVTRLAPLLSAPKEDDTTRLLSALRPFLSEQRVRKLEEAERLLSLTRVLSILKESKLM